MKQQDQCPWKFRSAGAGSLPDLHASRRRTGTAIATGLRLPFVQNSKDGGRDGVLRIQFPEGSSPAIFRRSLLIGAGDSPCRRTPALLRWQCRASPTALSVFWVPCRELASAPGSLEGRGLAIPGDT